MRGGRGDRHLVLVGGGHSHVQVLRALAMRPLHGVRVTCVVDQPVAVYSGMMPALLAGEVAPFDVEIDVRPLARAAGVSLVVDPAVRVTAEAVELASGPSLRFDAASVDVGSTVLGADREDVRSFAIPSRPIGHLMPRWEARLAALPRGRTLRVVVVGGGAAGVEVVACALARLRRDGLEARGTLVAAPGPVPERPRLARAVRRAFAELGVEVVEGARAERVLADRVQLDDGREVPAEVVFWVTGAAPVPLLAASPLPKDDRGFLRVRDTLQVVGHDHVFAAGDAAVLEGAPWMPRAGVYAVRAGPVLVDNLRAWAAGTPPRRWSPQRDFLALLNLGDGTAIASRGPLALRGRWVHRWKDRIDRAFMERFQRLGPDGALREGHAVMMAEDAPCGGCAAKVSATALGEVLNDAPPDPPDVVLGLRHAEDVVAARVGGAEVVASVDGFVAFTDDDALVGEAAALNATSDLHAKGVVPRFALAWVTVPEGGAAERLRRVMAGVRAGLAREGVTLLGGHSSLGVALQVGLTVFGEGPVRWPQAAARVGDALVLTRPLGAGVLWWADMRGLAASRDMDRLIAATRRGNAAAARIASRFDVSAATDVTGFGLAGHAAGMMAAAGTAARLVVRDLPLWPGALALWARGHVSTADPANRSRLGVSVQASGPAVAAAFDPQTVGGLLLAVAPAQAQALVDALRAAGDEAAVVGTVQARVVSLVELV